MELLPVLTSPIGKALQVAWTLSTEHSADAYNPQDLMNGSKVNHQYELDSGWTIDCGMSELVFD